MRNLFSPLLLKGILILFLTYQAIPLTVMAQKQTSLSFVSSAFQNIDSIKKIAVLKSETDYTIPSFTILRKAIVTANLDSAARKRDIILEAINNLQSKEVPYSITININKDPSTKMAFNWFTNTGIIGGKVQIIGGLVKNTKQFDKPLVTINAKVDPVNNLNYSVSSNGLSKLAGIPENTKKSYMSNKALVTGLKPNTTYSFRVGKEGSWSDIGTFKTADKRNREFSFIYTTDPQANTEEMFNISQKTTHAAYRMYPNANFWLNCGDLVQSSGNSNSEWEWEQVFLTQQDIFLHLPYTPILGNHDKSLNRNFTSHFNTDSTEFDFALSTTPGSVYSFIYGNTLFLALSFEDYSKKEYLETLARWIRNQVSTHPNVKWRIAYYHKTIYTGSTSHQDDSDSKLIRDRIAPLFDSLKIDLALQGHDHIYEVIGPIKGKKLVPESIKDQISVPVNTRENVTGRLNGVFNVKEGTLFFLNNSAGRKKYEPQSKVGMDSIETKLGINNYFSLFTGRFGQTGQPTFSNIKITNDSITITTYEVSDEGTASIFDKIKIVK